MNRSMNRMGRGLVTALAVIALPPIVGARAVDATAQRGAIPGAASQSGGIACLAKPALADRLAFASLDDARRILARPDSYSRQLSVFDRGAHLRTTEPTTTQDYLRFAAAAARAWTPDEEAYWSTLAGGLSDALAGLNLRIPQMSMVKTSGLEQFGAAYTRNRAIVLPEGRVAIAGDTRRDFFLLAHELFHVLSGENPAQRRALYALLGFQPVANFEYPLELESRRITNPNTGAHLYDHALGVRTGSGPEDVVPIPVARSAGGVHRAADGAASAGPTAVLRGPRCRPPAGGRRERRCTPRRRRLAGDLRLRQHRLARPHAPELELHPPPGGADGGELRAADGMA
jgi:hypothetical protein